MSRADQIWIAKQSDLRSAATTAAYSPPVNSVSKEFDRETLNDAETLGTRAPGPIEYGGRIYKPQIEASLRPASVGLIFSSFFGPPTSTQPDASGAPTVYQHVWDLAQLQNPTPITLWTKNADTSPVIRDQYVGGLGNELELSVEANAFWKYTAGYFFRDLVADPTEPTQAKDTSKKFPFTHVTVEFGPAGGSYSSLPASNFTLTYNNNLSDDDFILGSELVDSIALGDIEPELKFTARSDIPGHYRRALADEPQSMQLRITATGPTIESTYAYSLQIELHSLQTVEAPVSIDGSETLKDIEVTAHPALDETTGRFITITLTNTEDGTEY
ncbi:phage tail tube protein [Rubrobacter calidifluminis]|uniref:phage tail tube protein n=1 Tax=Rubrobacter calidifluminis TaxID=1392640 RepID=UPI0023631440|nr:phage tail tube protein [Rubrobacter calidifluminis]